MINVWALVLAVTAILTVLKLSGFIAWPWLLILSGLIAWGGLVGLFLIAFAATWFIYEWSVR